MNDLTLKKESLKYKDWNKFSITAEALRLNEHTNVFQSSSQFSNRVGIERKKKKLEFSSVKIILNSKRKKKIDNHWCFLITKFNIMSFILFSVGILEKKIFKNLLVN